MHKISIIFQLLIMIYSSFAFSFKNQFKKVIKSRIRMVSTSNLTKKKDYNHILALDFDGVICASSEESSYSSILAAKIAWPQSFLDFELTSLSSLQLQKSIQKLRPIIETGYENMLIARYVNENPTIDIDKLGLSWSPAFRDELIKEYGISKVRKRPSYII